MKDKSYGMPWPNDMACCRHILLQHRIGRVIGTVIHTESQYSSGLDNMAWIWNVASSAIAGRDVI